MSIVGSGSLNGYSYRLASSTALRNECKRRWKKTRKSSIWAAQDTHWGVRPSRETFVLPTDHRPDGLPTIFATPKCGETPLFCLFWDLP